MHTGIVDVFCPVCGKVIHLNQNKPPGFFHHKAFGWVCNKECHEKAETKYVRMIIGEG